MTTGIEKIPLEKISLDRENPRLVEFGITPKSKEEDIIEILWNEMAVDELMYSIVSNKFWEYEPLILLKDEGKYIAVEGNRRLAAVKLIHGLEQKESVRIPSHIREKISKELLKQTEELPAILIDSREEAWRHIGFKHVNGPAKWGSFAKAKYIAQVHNDFDISIDDIAYQIGDTNKTAQKLYQGLMVLEQAKNVRVYNYEEDHQTPRIYFSHLYTGLQREGIKSFLNIKDAGTEDKSPVPDEKHKELGQLLKWLFGSKQDNTEPIIKSQNPDLKYLDEVLQNKEATVALNSGVSLTMAHEISRPTEALFEESLLAAKRYLTSARGYMTTGYNGEESILQAADSVAQLAYDLYEDMERVYNRQSKQSKRPRFQK
jgi:DNA-binding transcriptional MerR regulator